MIIIKSNIREMRNDSLVYYKKYKQSRSEHRQNTYLRFIKNLSVLILIVY